MLTYLIGMSSVLVLGPVRRVGERFVAAFVLTHIWFFSGVRSQVRFQILQSGVGLCTTFKLQARSKSGLILIFGLPGNSKS